MKKIVHSIVFVSMFGSIGLQATFWEGVTGFGTWCSERYTEVKTAVKEGTKTAFTQTGKELPFSIIAILGLWIRNKVLYNHDEVEAYYRTINIARKKNFLETVESDLYKQKEDLESEWDQIKEDDKQLSNLKYQLDKKTIKPGIFTILKARVLGKKVNVKSPKEVQKLTENVDNLEKFLKKHKADHRKHRERLADLIEIYYDQYKEFLKEKPYQSATPAA